MEEQRKNSYDLNGRYREPYVEEVKKQHNLVIVVCNIWYSLQSH